VIDTADAVGFAAAWAAAWNAHDLDAVLAHFAEDVVFTSPIAARLLGGDGIVRGKDALRAYWAQALPLNPDLRFTVAGVYVGVDTVVVNYRNQKDVLCCEVLHFADGLVVSGHGTYLGTDPDPAGLAPGPRG
jgi:ketosteroid isomerase-like protein